MKSYITYQSQTRGFKDVSETVKTMEKIAASSAHFLRQEVSGFNLYATEIEKALTELSQFYQEKDHPLLRRKSGSKALVILTGNKGLVGKLWREIVNAFLKNNKRYQFAIVVGARGKSYLKEEGAPIAKSFAPSEIEHITGYIFGEFKKETFTQVDILYPQFISLADQTPKIISFLPFKFTLSEISRFGDKNAAGNKQFKQKRGEGLPIFEPSKRRIFNKLLQKYIKIFFHKIIMETKLSELSARTVATEHAAEKTKKLVRKLALNYAKERRRIITQRQIESFAARRII